MLALVLAASCGGDGGSAVPKSVAEPVAAPTTSTTAPPPADVALTVTGAEVVGPASAGVPLVDPTLGEVVALVDGFLDVTSLGPLTGRPGPGLAHLLLDAAALQAVREDRAVVFDEGVEPSTSVTASEATVSFRALAGNDGGLELIVADFVWDVASPAVHVRRTGELTIVPTAAGWQIGTYDVAVERT